MQSVIIIVAAGRVHLIVSRERKHPFSVCCIVGMYTNLGLLFAAKIVIFVSMKSIISETEMKFHCRMFTSRGKSVTQSIYFYSRCEVKLHVGDKCDHINS